MVIHQGTKRMQRILSSPGVRTVLVVQDSRMHHMSGSRTVALRSPGILLWFRDCNDRGR